MPKNRGLYGVLLWGALLAVAAAIDTDLPTEIPDGPLDIQAPGGVEYSNQTYIARGGVTGRFENVVIRADTMSVNPETGDLHAGGNILFKRDNVIWQGSDLNYNFINHEGLFGPSALYFEPAFLSVDHVERVSTNEYLLRGATFTTCPEDSPHIHARAKEARLVDEKYIKAKGVVFYVGKVPVFYVPYWRHKLREGIFTFKMGMGSEWGAYALIKATLPVGQHLDYITDVNLYSKRGVGIGQGFSWEHPKAVGEFAAFYLKDQDPHARFNSPEIGADRYRFKLEHLQNFTDTHYLNTKWNYLSDPAILEEFFKSEYRNNAQPENYASWVYGNSYIGSEAFVNKRLNDFYDNVDRLEYSADLYRTRLGNTPFYLQSENAVTHLERVYSNTNLVDNTYDSVRIDSGNTLYLPQRYGFLSLVPRAGYRATYYSKTDVATGGGDELRQIPGAGVEVSFQATKILSERERWYGKGLRHKIEPYADYSYENSSVATNRLLQFDDVDELMDENRLKMGLRNVLQTKRDGRLARFIDLDLYTYYLVEQNAAEQDFDLLYLDARMPLTRRTMIDLEGTYDWYAGKIPDFNTRISYDRDDVIFSLEHYYEKGIRSLWTPRIDLFPKGNVSIEAYGRYDDNDNDLQEVALIGYKNFCCMRYGLGYHYYDDGEQRIMFSVGLSAFPEARFSSGL
jgi:LPS-assembly protein